mmetsp:Transcript_6994/g.25791  ORF Transcript_6994/g.25791 Transcript_6994/m.25791 type:complete len:683 (+) Transcript_6994:198-2246(+)
MFTPPKAKKTVARSGSGVVRSSTRPEDRRHDNEARNRIVSSEDPAEDSADIPNVSIVQDFMSKQTFDDATSVLERPWRREREDTDTSDGRSSNHNFRQWEDPCDLLDIRARLPRLNILPRSLNSDTLDTDRSTPGSAEHLLDVGSRSLCDSTHSVGPSSSKQAKSAGCGREGYEDELESGHESVLGACRSNCDSVQAMFASLSVAETDIAAGFMQSHWKRVVVRGGYARMNNAATLIQRVWRQHLEATRGHKYAFKECHSRGTANELNSVRRPEPTDANCAVPPKQRELRAGATQFGRLQQASERASKAKDVKRNCGIAYHESGSGHGSFGFHTSALYNSARNDSLEDISHSLWQHHTVHSQLLPLGVANLPALGLHIGSKPMGEGTFGRVFEARLYSKESHMVALKQLKPHPRYKTRELRSKFLEEIQVHVALQEACAGRHIIQLEGVVTLIPGESGVSNLAGVYELAKHSLWDAMGDDGRIGLRGSQAHHRVLLEWSLQLAEALQFMHCRGYMHRDIKSPNVLVDVHNRLRLADFGEARRIKYGPYFDRVGTYSWSAPEALLKQSQTEQVDVYSYGMVLWEMVTWGEQPDQHLISNLSAADGGLAELVAKVGLGRQRPRMPDCPLLIRGLIYWCWCHDPTQRPSFNEVVRHIHVLGDTLVGRHHEQVPLGARLTMAAARP